MGKAQKILTGETISEEELKEIKREMRRKRRWRGKYARIKRHTTLSGIETVEKEPKRISSYLSEELKKKIMTEIIKKGYLSEETAEEAVSYLEGLDGFDNLFASIPDEVRDWFKRWIQTEYFNWRTLKREKVRLKSGERITGKIIEPKKTYVIPIEILGKKYFQVRDWQTGRFIGTYRADRFKR